MHRDDADYTDGSILRDAMTGPNPTTDPSPMRDPKPKMDPSPTTDPKPNMGHTRSSNTSRIPIANRDSNMVNTTNMTDRNSHIPSRTMAYLQ